MREVARYDYTRAVEISRWPLNEVLIAYLAKVRVGLIEKFRHDELVWSLMSPFIPRKDRPPEPSLPPLVKDAPIDE